MPSSTTVCIIRVVLNQQIFACCLGCMARKLSNEEGKRQFPSRLIFPFHILLFSCSPSPLFHFRASRSSHFLPFPLVSISRAFIFLSPNSAGGRLSFKENLSNEKWKALPAIFLFLKVDPALAAYF